MTMETLERVMIEAYIGRCKQSGWELKEDAEVTPQDVKEYATQEVLDFINSHMKIRTAVDLSIDEYDYIDAAVEDEQDIGHDVEYIPKLFDEPVFEIGYYNADCATTGLSMTYVKGISAFITDSGEWKFAEYYGIEDSDNKLTYTAFKKTEEEYYGIESLGDMVPDIEIDNYID